MIALIVLAIEKLSEFITALISSRASGEIEVLKFVINTILSKKDQVTANPQVK